MSYFAPSPFHEGVDEVAFVDVKAENIIDRDIQDVLENAQISSEIVGVQWRVVDPLKAPIPRSVIDTRRFEYLFKDSVLIDLRGVAPNHRGPEHGV